MNLRGKLTLFAKIALVTGGLSYMLTSVSAEATIFQDAKTQKTYEKISEEAFEESIDAYDNYVTNLADILGEYFGTEDVIKIFGGYLTMSENGYLSFGSRTEDENIVDIPGQWGMNVVMGDAVCRHHADNLSRVLNKMGFETCVVLGEMYEGDEPKNDPNHAVVYVKDDDKIILLDPINGTIFVKGKKTYESVHGDYKFNPSLTCDQVYGFSKDSVPVYFNHDDITYSKTNYIKDLSVARQEAEYHKSNLSQEEDANLKDYEMMIFKEMLYYQTLYGVVEERLGDTATEQDVLEDVLTTYEVMDELTSGAPSL